MAVVAAAHWLWLHYVGQDSSAVAPEPWQSFTVAVAVLSARENQEQRHAVRRTWMQAASVAGNQTRAVVKFVIGNSSCPWHPTDRTTAYSCVPWHVSPAAAAGVVSAVVPAERKNASLQSTSSGGNALARESWPLTLELSAGCQLAFRVMHSVTVVGIGVRLPVLHQWVHQGRAEPLIVDVIDATTEVTIATASFHATDLAGYLWSSLDINGDDNSDRSDDINREDDLECTFVYRTLAVHALLSKDFAGVVRCLSCEPLDERCSTSYDNSGLIQWVVETSRLQLHGGACGGAVSFQMQAAEPARLLEHVSNYAARQSGWASHTAKVAELLAAEAAFHHDLVFVDTLDVYRNLADKLLKGVRWFRQHHEFEYFMKTDDDCYVDVDAVVDKLSRLEDTVLGQRGLWLGSFRRDWAVQRHGKWAEEAYVGIAYPDFACGAGYVISASLADWLSVNEASLWRFQGEDVSMGIWLTSVQPTLVQEHDVLCSKYCTAGAIAIPDLTTGELVEMWARKLLTGQPC